MASVILIMYPGKCIMIMIVANRTDMLLKNFLLYIIA